MQTFATDPPSAEDGRLPEHGALPSSKEVSGAKRPEAARRLAPARKCDGPPKLRHHAPRPVPNLKALPDDALLCDADCSRLSGYTRQAFKKWRREGKGRGPKTVYVEGRPRTTVAWFREWAGLAR